MDRFRGQGLGAEEKLLLWAVNTTASSHLVFLSEVICPLDATVEEVRNAMPFLHVCEDKEEAIAVAELALLTEGKRGFGGFVLRSHYERGKTYKSGVLI